jgi:pyrrolysine biosynthesis protein PylD
MGGNLRDRPVLVIGCGPVGNSATETLIRMGARITVYDIHRSKCRDLKEAVGTSSKSEIRLADDLDTALYENPFILDASPAENIITADHITPKTYISAPGIPLGLSEAAISKISNRLLHDPLHLGVVTMLAMAVKHQPSGVRNRFM